MAEDKLRGCRFRQHYNFEAYGPGSANSHEIEAHWVTIGGKLKRSAYDVARLAGGSLSPAQRGGHHEEIVQCWHQGLMEGGVTGYTREDAWHDYRLSAIMAMLNPVLVHYMFKTGGGRGTALGAAMTERFFSDLVECGAEAVVP